MTAWARSYARLFTRMGRRVSIERLVANGDPIVVASVRARVRGATAEEVASGIKASERRVLLLAADIPPDFLPIRQGDRVLLDGIRLVFNARPDDQAHRRGAQLLAISGFATGG